MQGLGGLAPGLGRGATMSGNRPASGSNTPLAYILAGMSFDPLSATYTVVKAGRYRIVAWGGGGTRVSSDGGGGGLAIKDVRLSLSSAVSITVGSAAGAASSRNNTSVTLPDGTTILANGGVNDGGAGGTASGGDINVSGSVGGQAGSYDVYVGGAAAQNPGGGGAVQSANTRNPGAGLVMILYLGE